MAAMDGATSRDPGFLVQLAHHAERTPAKIAVRVLADDGSERACWSYAQLLQAVTRTAQALAQRVPAGERVLLLLPTGLDYIAGFLGCFGAGVCAVPAFPPESAAAHAQRVVAIARAARPRLVLAEAAHVEATAQRMAAAGAPLPTTSLGALWQSADAAPLSAAMPRWPEPRELALLQYTSGSTAQPKGVMVTHGNLVANQRAIAHAFGIDHRDVIVSWLPLYHDMGLLGSLLQALYTGCELVLLSPGQFVRAPARWLAAISGYRGTVSGGPDFGYRMCVERASQDALDGLDLRSWRLAFTGAEPIRAGTLEAFAERFAPHGLRTESLYACYGLAEATLLVTGAPRDRRPHTRSFDARALECGQLTAASSDGPSVTLVACGRPMPEHAVRIAADGGEALPEGRVGEIWFTGPSVTHGYFESPRETAETFVEHGGARYLRTGDLGALVNGELFIVGREKDLIIVRGRNLYPQDIEQSVESAVEILQKGRVAAFALDEHGEERVAVAVEVSRAAQKLLREDALVQVISEALASSHLEAPHTVLLLKPGGLPRTTSGKLQRRAARAAFRAGKLGVYAHYERGVKLGETAQRAPIDAQMSALEARLCAIWSELLGAQVTRPDAHFFALAGNSVLAAQLGVRVAQELGVELPLSAIFAQPTVRGLAEVIEQKCAEASVPGSAVPPPPSAATPANGERTLPLSASQRSLWLALALDSEPAAFHVAASIELRGLLRPAALGQALSQLVQRHEALRTTFALDARGAEPHQRVHAQMAPPQPFHAELSRAVLTLGREDAARGFVECQAQRAFDLAHGPLFSCALGQLDDSSSLLVLTAHHLVLDGSSLRILLAELVDGYRQACGAQLQPLERAVSVNALSDAVTADQLQRELDQARAQLTAAPEHGQLPLDHPRPARPTRRAERVLLTLPAALTQQLAARAQADGVTLAVELLACYAALLQRYTGAHGVRIGLPLANRDGALALRAVGMCVRTAVLALAVDTRQSICALVSLVAAQLGVLMSQRALSLDTLVRACAPERSAGRAALFDVAFNYQSGLTDALSEWSDVQVLGLDTFTGFTQFDLTLDLQLQIDGSVRCSFEYARELFDAASILGMARSYQRLLDACVSDPQLPLSLVTLMDAPEREQLAAAYTYAPGPARAGMLVPEQLARVAARHAGRVAVCAGGERITYAALEARAETLARVLYAQGVGPEQCVGIHLGRAVDAFVSMLAVWKTGAAFAPLDPSYPAARLAHMRDAARIRLVISDAPDARELAGAQVVHPANDPPLTAAELTTPDRHRCSLAYVIFTSGSTGLPKPVAVEHGALAMHCDAIMQLYDFGCDVCALHGASLSFDASLEQWLVPALAGGRIVLRPDGAWSAHELLRCVQLEGVTHLYPPTPLLSELAHEVLRTGSSTQVQSCTVGGEAVPRETVALLTRAFPQLALYNGYGPTETVVTPLIWRRAADSSSGYAPIGRAVGERRSYVLSDALEPVPRGAAGELFIAGGSARGYLHRPRETAERFLPDPFGKGGRVYRTGDLTRMAADGTVHYLSRSDGQIKLRGHRIELGEVESALLDQPGVREAAVLLRRGAGQGAQLCAYVAGESALEHSQLRAALAARLPGYMVPGHLLLVAALPRTPNGKLDVAALPDPELASTGAAPRGPREQLLAALFAELLGVCEVGRDADFFSLGGDSILALQLSSRARERGFVLSPRQVLEHPSVRALAAVVSPLTAAATCEDAEPNTDVPLLPIARELFRLPLSERHHYNQAVLLRASAPLDVELLGAALDQVVQHHAAFRLRFTTSAQGAPRAWLAEHATCTLELAEAAGPHQLRSACERVQRGFELERGPLLRALLIRLPQRQERLLLCAHHLVMDGVSFRFVLEDLGAAYAAQRAGYTAQLPANSCSYASFARALSAYAQGEAIAASRSYWQQHVREPVASWPARSLGTLAEAGRCETRLDRHATELLLQRAPGAYGTRGAELLLAALAQVLCDALNTQAVRIEVEGHGRELPGAGPDASRCVGWFTSTYPLVLRAGDGAQRITLTKEALRAAAPHALAYGALRELCGELDDVPQAGLTFNYLGQLDGTQERSGFQLVHDDRGPDLAESSPLRAGLVLDGQVQRGELSFTWTYDSCIYSAEQVQALASGYERALRALIAHCGSGERRALTPSDVPLAGLTRAELASLPYAASEIDDVWALTPMQQGLLAHALQSAHGDPYLVRRGFKLSGALDPVCFQRALEHVVARHAVLRSVYLWENLAHPVQVVLRAACLALQLEQHDLRVDAAARTADATGFSLARAGAGVFELVQNAPQEHWLFWTHHHIALDGWSMSSILLELLTVYAQHAAGLQLQAAGSTHERGLRARQLASHADEAALLPQLQGAVTTPLPQFATSLPAADAAAAYAEQTSSIHGEPLAILKAGAAQAGVTLSSLLQAAYALLLAQHADAQEVMFGVTLSGRSQLGEAALGAAGLFINTLPLRLHIIAQENVGAYLRRVQQQSLALQEHEHASLAALTRGCQLDSTASLFETALVFENYPIDRALRQGAGALSIALLDADDPAAGVRYTRGRNHFPLSIVAQLDEQLSLVFAYQRARFVDTDVSVLAEQLLSLALRLAQGVDRPVCELCARPSIPELRAPDAVSNAQDVSVLDAFASALQRVPRRAAVSDAGGTWSYATLARRAQGVRDALAGLLRGSEPRVAVILPRSRELCAAMLGVLQAGAVYVPFEPETPSARLRGLLESAGCQCVIGAGSAAQLRALEALGRPVLDLTRVAEAVRLDPMPPCLPLQAAYMIFTSGSTGAPKAVVVSHGALAHYVHGVLQRFAFGDDASSMALVSTAAADLGHTMLFGALCSGRTLHVLGHEVVTDSEAFARVMSEQRIAVLKIVPSHLRALLDCAQPARVLPEHALILGGEATDQQLMAAVRSARPDLRVLNHYGPTETTVGVLTFEDKSRVVKGALPTGLPLPGVYVRVLDCLLREVPLGAVGELYVGGPSLARGYHGAAAATAERFVPDPFAAGARLYRTGDRVRVVHGQLCFVGRKDEQLKVRGHRVEPGEIAAAVRGVLGVRDAAVLAERDAGAGQVRLLAFYVPVRDLQLPAAQVARALAEQLPAHMVPELIELQELPRTANGKVDRARLRAAATKRGPQLDAPVGPVETQLAAIMCEVLGIQEVSRTASFAAMGGDSILSLRVIARVRRAGWPLTPRQLAQAPCLAALAAELRASQPSAAEGAAAQSGVGAPSPRELARHDVNAAIELSHDGAESCADQVSLQRAQPVSRTASHVHGGGAQRPRAQPGSRAHREDGSGAAHGGMAAVGGPHPLSFEQERLWFLWKLEPHSSAYNIAAALRLTGRLDQDALTRALGALIARHPLLRTAFLEQDGQPFAVVQPAAQPLDAAWISSETMPLPAAQAELSRWAAQPFDLSAGQPLRWGLIRLAHEELVLGIAMHHIVADGWSMNLLMREFARDYAAAASGEALSYTPSPEGYAQYAAWQRKQLDGPERERCLAYWRAQLGTEHAPLQLSFDRPRSAQPSRRGDSVALRLPNALVSRARALAVREGTSLFSVLLSALHVLLARDSGERDVRVGVSMAQRPTVESEDMLGFFVQTLVHRAQLPGRIDFRRLLQQVSRDLLDAQAHAELPFSQLVAALAPERSSSHDPLVQVLFNHQKRAVSSLLTLPGLRVERLELPVRAAQFELSLHTEEDEHGALRGQLVYATDLFDARTVERLARRYELLLTQLCTEPHMHVDDAVLLDDADRALLAELNASACSYAQQPLVPALIGQQLRALGARPALACGDVSLSGAELDARANALAHVLRGLGVGPESRVGVCLPRSLELVIAVLGVLKAGAAYVALEPELPDARLQRMLAISEARCLIGTGEARERFRAWAIDPAHSLLTPQDVMPAARSEAPDVALHGEHLAYVIFTSGSTGAPKAVASRHAGILNRLQWMQAQYTLDASDVVLHKTPFGFDVSVWELLWPLMCGAQLVVAEPDLHRDPAALAELIVRRAVTTVHFVPSMLAAFVEHPAAAQCSSLERVVCSGEALSPALADALLSRLSQTQLFNLYGPTEASIDVTHWTCRAGELTVPIGRPIANMSVLVLDAQLQPLAAGVAGELYLSGVGLARGYLGAAALTAERFLPHPQQPGARMYRTGDRVRVRADGTLSYLGRSDAQIKLRGVRIELGEVEAALAACPGVQRAAAVVQPGPSLTGYVVGEGLDGEQLRAALRRTLPDTFVPAQIVILPELPLTASGKVDRKALPTPTQTRAEYLAPEPGLQMELAALWAELLQVQRVGQSDDFFALGGHSLLGARLLARLEAEHGVRLPLKELFRATRLSELATLVARARAQSAGSLQLMASMLDELEGQ